MVFPGMVYISHPTEYGTLYSKRELEAIARVCHEHKMPLYMDGARLAYGLTAPGTDVTLADIARFCDVFYIGGTKCGAFFGEAVVFTRHNLPAHFLTRVKQHGALLAKGHMLGIQFDTLFTDNLYCEIGAHAIRLAQLLQNGLRTAGLPLYINSPTKAGRTGCRVQFLGKNSTGQNGHPLCHQLGHKRRNRPGTNQDTERSTIG